MRKSSKIIVAGLSASLLALAATNVNAQSQTGDASVSIATAITIVQDIPMAFGNVLKDTNGATLVLDTAGAITGAPVGYTLAGGEAAGVFTATGDINAAVSVSFVDGVLTGPGTAMTLDTLTTDAAATFDAAGSLTFNVGASLTIAADQAVGDYAGTYTVTVNYQ